MADMAEVTLILQAIDAGDSEATAKLLPLVYEELRRLARARMSNERVEHTLQPTALVHEAYLRLVGGANPRWNNRGHFFAAAAEAMRRILVESARRKQTQKRGGGLVRHSDSADELPVAIECDPLETLAVHEMLDRLAAKSPRIAELVKLRYFLGCTLAEAAEVLGIAPATAEDDWTYARAWLRREWLRNEANS